MITPEKFKHPGSLSRQIVDFCRFLREHEFTIGPFEEQEAMSVLANTPGSSWDEFRLILKLNFCKNPTQFQGFDLVFDEFWGSLFKSFNSKSKPNTRPRVDKPQQKPKFTELKNWLFQHDVDRRVESAFYSEGNLTDSKFSMDQENQVRELVCLLRKFALDWSNRPGRRFSPSNKPSFPDIRRSIRSNIQYGEILDLKFQEKKPKKLELVLLCDTSRSMEIFSKFTLQLLFAFQTAFKSIETFIFSSELNRITPSLKQGTYRDLLTNFKKWSGGTRIGASLDQFIHEYGKHRLSRRTVVLIISDGWDLGETKLLEQSMQYIQRQVFKVIWFNPHAGKPGFKPQVRGMKAALPYVDIFHGAHNIDTIRDWQRSGYRSLYK